MIGLFHVCFFQLSLYLLWSQKVTPWTALKNINYYFNVQNRLTLFLDIDLLHIIESFNITELTHQSSWNK